MKCPICDSKRWKFPNNLEESLTLHYNEYHRLLERIHERIADTNTNSVTAQILESVLE